MIHRKGKNDLRSMDRVFSTYLNTCIAGRTDSKSNIAMACKSPTVVCLQRKDGKVVQDCDVYIGREWYCGGWDLKRSIWANPYRATTGKTVNSRVTVHEVCHTYEKYLRDDAKLMSLIPSLGGKRLGCWCIGKYPRCPSCGLKTCRCYRCHGEVIVKIFNELALQKKNDVEVNSINCDDLIQELIG